jgi:hypothetical protein
MYQFRLFRNNGFALLATSNDFTVEPPAGGDQLTASPGSVAPDGTMTVTWNGISQSQLDWIGLNTPGASPTQYIDWIYVSCSKTPSSVIRTSGSCTYRIPSALPAGTYEMRFFSNNGFSVVATSNSFTVH